MYAASARLDFEKAARLRDDLGALNRALEKQAIVLGDGTDADVDRRRGRPARGGRADLPRPRRAGCAASAAGWPRRPRTPTSAGSSSASCSQLYAGESGDARAARDPRPRAARGRTRPSRSGSAGLRGSRVRVRVPAARRQEGAAGDRRPQRQAVDDAAQDQARLRPDQPQPGAGGHPGRARAAGGAAARSSASTSRTSRAPRWWGRWWSSRTAWPASRSTAGSWSAGSTGRTTSPPCTRSSPGGSGGCSTSGWSTPEASASVAPARSRSRGRPGAAARRPGHRAHPKFAYAPGAGGRRRRPAAGGRGPACPRRARHRRRAGLRAGQAAGGDLAARAGGPGHHAAHQRGAVPAPARARRGAPLRDHPPPWPPVQDHGGESARRRPGPGGGAPQGAAAPVRLTAEDPRGHGGGDRRGARASADRTARGDRRGAAQRAGTAPRASTPPPARSRRGT